jgi:hypothetical protein
MNLKNSPFQRGLYMRVPKGTPLINRWGHETNVELTKRDVVVEISSTMMPEADAMLTAEELRDRQIGLHNLAEKHRKEREAFTVEVHYPAVTYPASRGAPAWTQAAFSRHQLDPAREAETTEMWHRQQEEVQALAKEYTDLGNSRYSFDEVLVGWSNDNKWAKAKDLELAEKPEARKKEPKVNLRQQMVPKSRWEFKQDVDIYYGARNPAYDAIVDAWDKANPRPVYQHRSMTQAQQQAHSAAFQKHGHDREAMREAANKSVGEFTPILYRNIKAGEVFEVTGKFNSFFYPHGWGGQSYGNAAEVVFDGESVTKHLEYSMIKDAIQAVSIPTVKAYVLRHKTTGLFYKTYQYDYDHRSSKEFELEYGDTFMKGKKWDNLGKAKTSILMMTGYYEGLPGADAALPEWSGGGASMSKNQLEQFDLVEFDKLSRKEIGVVAEFEAWFKRSWELRALTVKYGSAVRTTYKALEKSKLLDKQKGMVVFTVTDQDKIDNIGYYSDDKSALTEEDKDEIKLATASMAKGTFKTAIDHKSMAVSFPNKGAAMMFKLSYNGNLKVSVIDLDEMKEAVND